MACTTILVGKNASYDGSTMIARNDDSGSGTFTAKKLQATIREGKPLIPISVNFSRKHNNDPDFVAKVAKPQQDNRFDVPTVGLQTLQDCDGDHHFKPACTRRRSAAFTPAEDRKADKR